MRGVAGLAWKGLACALVGLALGAGSASAEESTALGGTGSSPLESPLVVPEAQQALLGGELVGDAEEARRLSPEAVAARIASATAYESLNAEQAAKLGEELFPGLIDHPAGGPPQLPAGQTITGYLTDNAAQVDLGGGKHAIVESTAPIAVESSSSGQRVPVDLDQVEAGSGFQPATPVVGLQIPKRLSEGVRLPGVGVSLTPVGGPAGEPLGGSQGAIVGRTVLYANTQTDMDTVIKPITAGFEADTLLRSMDSPQQLYFRVGLPEGASLVQAKDGSGAVEVVEEGTVIATVAYPDASDATGAPVPVSMAVSGDTLVLSVDDRTAEYTYPIEVDPTVIEERFTESGGERSNWQWETSNAARFASKPTDNKESKELSESGPTSLETYGTAAYAESEKAYWAYQTQGDSKIYDFTAETEAKNTEDHIESFLELEAKGTGARETKEMLSSEAEKTAEYARTTTPVSICPTNSEGKQECVPTAGGEGNAVRFQQSVTNKPTSKYSFSDFLYEGEVYLSEPAGTHSATSYNNSAPEFEIEVENSKKEKEKQLRTNALYGSGSWLSEYDGALEFVATDPGIGVSATRLEYESSPGSWEQVFEHNYLTEGNCTGVQCHPRHTELWTLNKRLPNGEDKIRYRAEDAMGAARHETESLETEGKATVKVDYSKPHGISTTGLPYGNELSEKTYELTAYATDGEGSTVPSSGVGSIVLSVDGTSIKDVSEKATGKNTEGTCSVSKGECTASAKYKIEGVELGAGHHAIAIVAKDRAGNEGREEETISIRHSTPVPIGPGSVDLQSGDFTLGPSDVSLGSGLSVSRVYSSRDLTAGTEASLLGPQWGLSTGSEESLVEMIDRNHSVLVTSGNGGQTIFAGILNSKDEPTGKFESPPGDSNLTLTLEENEKKEKLAYYLKDPAAGTSTKFALSSTAKVWVPTVQEGPVPTDAVSYIYQTVEVGGKKVTRPAEELAAHPKVSCSPKMEPGCRSLKFTYATKTKSEIGEGPTEWGEYEGRLVKVSYEGYNPVTKKMTETPIPVAEYAYDKQGRLRAEWDPRLAPHELKTTYGYDKEGHVTALTPPGQESWAFTYGTIMGDSGTGRLLKVTRAPASEGLWSGDAVENTEAPKITGEPVMNGRLAASRGAWSGQPVVYGFQWETCNATGQECAPIAGATDPNYTPTESDIGHEIVMCVTATNGGGSVVARSASTAPVESFEVTTYSGSASGGITVGPDKNLWFTGSHIGKITTYGTVTEYELPSGSEPTEITSGSGNYLWFTDRGTSKIGRISTSGEIKEYSLPKESRPQGIAQGPEGDLWFTEEKTGKIGRITTEGVITEYAGAGFPYKIVAGPAKENAMWFTDNQLSGKEGYVGKIATASSAEGSLGKIHIYGVSELATTWGITDGPDGNIWFTGSTSTRIARITPAGEIKEYSRPPMGFEKGIGAGPSGENALWFAASETKPNRVGRATTAGAVSEYPLPAENSFSQGVAGPDGNMWFSDGTKIARLKPVPSNLAEAIGPQPGTTIDYDVPVSGAGAPNNMSANEVAKWGQKSEEAPVEATAIFPPDSPQGWPASNYTRASIYYLDEEGRVVNTATPSTGAYGSIATSEYNETNDVVRTLSPDNRATALEAGTKSEEVASLLSTFNTYKNKCSSESEFTEERESTEPGTRLCETEGPAHAVKYMAGKEQKEAPYARDHAIYFYDQKVPSEGPDKESFSKETFNLLTKTQNLVKIVNSKGEKQQEVEPRTTVTSYSGQNNLGWKLREPTSVTVEPEGAKVTHSTLYYEEGSEAMGQVMETRGPEGSAGNSAHDAKIVYYSEEENKEYAACGKHPEWAGLVCESLAAKQPEATGLPNLPITTTTYNLWNEPETIAETFPKSVTFGEKTRTTKDKYDAAGRMESSEETSTASTESTDKALPKVTNVYNEKTGMLEKQSTTVGEKTKTITSAYNTLGQLETYTDADGNVAKFKYGGPEKDGLLEEMSDSSDNGESNQKYTYSETTKQLVKLVDSAAGTFTASYDAEGKLASEIYPNGICANYTNNSVGEATHIEYTKTTSCSEKEGVWFSETRIPSVRGETMSRMSTLASEEYAYDTLGRLTEVHETPAGEYCKTRIYAYDEESNRTELKTREPNTKKECATEGGTVEKHTYDEANRLTDSGIAYDPLGNITKLPSGDAEGHALESTFYVDNAVATQTQNGVTNDYYLDPSGRVRETVSGAKKVITHYDGSGEATAWTCEGAEKGEKCESGGKWTRNIPGIEGALTAIQNGTGAVGETPILQLHDLQGDVVATIKDKAGETKLESTYNSTEFGVPSAGKEPPKFAWLGAGGVEKSLASGVITEGATSYVPQTGRALQSEEVAPPGLPNGSGAGAPYIFQEEPWVLQGATREADEAPGLEAGREREAEEAACRANVLACPVEVDDPHWIWTFTIDQAEQLAGLFEAGKALSFTKIGDDIKSILGIDFVAQIEGKIEQAIAGFDQSEVEDWAYSIGAGLSICAYDAEIKLGHPYNPHCWVYVPTNNYHVGVHGPLGFIGVIFELPAFDKEAQVAYCLKGATYCYEV
jgi:streptogramin lyase